MTGAANWQAAAMLAHPCPDKTRADLEWDRLLGALADRCMSPAGRRLARALPFAETVSAIRTAYAELDEVLALHAAADPLPQHELPDVAAAVERARIGADLALDELRAVAALLDAARTLRRFLHGRRERCPALSAACALDPGLDALLAELARAFDPDGSLSDRASPRLGELRSERRASRDRLVRRLEELIHKHEAILSDRFWTERDGRYVLPVRSDAHERFPGIVHATSDSGATLFVEPRVLVSMGNRQKMLEGLVSREEHAILAALSARVAEQVESLAAADAALALADVRAATSKLARELELTIPEVVDPEAAPAGTPTLELAAIRHPLLALDGVRVVASDLSASAGRAVVVSGPNAGGKTVALKAVGLAALMVRAALPIAARTGSRALAFDLVLTDVGDEQSLARNLSTFSAHVANLASILERTTPGTLVLLDEIATGTDPREGEALAAGVLDSLCARGGTALCTTHYEGLKVLAHGDDRFVNASVGFDLTTMSPTFRLVLGVPGASSALAVARRYGIPSTVIERAERFLSQEVLGFDKMVEALAGERRALELARADAEREAAAARAARTEVEDELARIRAQGKKALDRETESLLAEVKRARGELHAAQRRIRSGAGDDASLRANARAIEAVARRTAIGGDLEPRAETEAADRPPVPADRIRVGTRVWVPRLRAEAEIVELLPRGELRVAAGPLKLMTTVDEIRAVAPSERNGGGKHAPARAPRVDSRVARTLELDAAADPDVPIQTTDNTVDLRGLRAHEAIGMAEQFLDRCMGAGRRVAFLVHGHGTGALRETLRSELGDSRYVARMRPGEPREGGDGVTVVWLR